MTIKINKGFTLIELLVVVSIISMLSSMTFSFLGDARQKGRDTEKIKSVIEVRKTLQMYLTENGYFPNNLQAVIEIKYISSINKNILYTGRDTSGNTCLNKCPSYHLAVPLERTDNMVLKTDSDKVTSNAIDGTKDNCLTNGITSNPDKCYDLVP